MATKTKARKLTDIQREWLDAATYILDQRETSAGYEHFFYDDESGEEGEESYCANCIKGYLPGQWESGEHYVYSYPEVEHDYAVRCECCNSLLAYTLTGYGVDYELDGFTGGIFDWNNPEHCYELARIAHGIYESNEQSRLLYHVLRNGRNLPTELEPAD